jgi:acetyl esterase/lipase
VAAPAQATTPEAMPHKSSIERWDKLSLRDNSLQADEPLMGEVDKLPHFTRELARVQWRSGDPIDLYILRPTGVAKPPVVIYLYGYPDEENRFFNNYLCSLLTRNGFAAVGFSSILTGQRYHDVPMKEWFVSDLEQSLVGTTHDVQMILNYLEKRGDFDMAHVGMFGEGSGGTIALLATSVDPRIKAVDVLDPWGDWPEWLATSPIVPDKERAEYTTPDFLNPLAPFDPVNFLPKFNAAPVRLQQTLFDQTITPAAVRQKIAESAPKSGDFVVYKDQQEYLDKASQDGKMLDWMFSHLQPAAGKTFGASPAGDSVSAKH